LVEHSSELIAESRRCISGDHLFIEINRRALL
jgi:hypothetical protein